MLTQQGYELFKMPLCKVYIQKIEDKAFFYDLDPLKETEPKADKELVSKEILLIISQQDEHIGIESHVLLKNTIFQIHLRKPQLNNFKEFAKKRHQFSVYFENIQDIPNYNAVFIRATTDPVIRRI